MRNKQMTWEQRKLFWVACGARVQECTRAEYVASGMGGSLEYADPRPATREEAEAMIASASDPTLEGYPSVGSLRLVFD